MYSFNLDYIFNLFYNLLLAIRYVWLFWILRISPETYLKDHLTDNFDGLRDRGWIVFDSSDISNSHIFSPIEIVKEKVFGFGSSTSSIPYQSNLDNINNTNTLNTGDGLNYTNTSFAFSKAENSLYSNLHFSIQNSILSFFADIITLFSFFMFLFMMYSFLSWLWLTIKGEFESVDQKISRQKEKLDKIKETKISKKEVKHVYVFDEKLNLSEEEKLAKIREIEGVTKKEDMDFSDNKVDLLSSSNQDFEMPAGIPDLPIDISDLDDIEKQKVNLLNNNYRDEKIKNEDWLKRWNIVLEYMNGKEEALWRIGILEADNLLNDLLIDRGYAGETVSEKLKNANFRTIELAWEAHKMRNRIAHEGSKFVLAEKVARKTIAMFEAILMEFKVIDN